jgi:hypothetical protein
MSKNSGAENLEQARLLGMSGEREAKHLARIEHLERELAFVTLQRTALLEACQSVAKDLADHPLCLDVSSSQEELDNAGGDAAFLTWNLQVLTEAIKIGAAS